MFYVVVVAAVVVAGLLVLQGCSFSWLLLGRASCDAFYSIDFLCEEICNEYSVFC